MGLDASVRCNCFESGKTKTPPFPRDWIILDDEGYINLRTEFENAKNWNLLYVWEQTCCEHIGMEAASEHIANWAGYRLFQQALATVDSEQFPQFPVLQQELPSANGGLTSSEASKKALLELEDFRRLASIGKNARLVDSKSGFVIFQHIGCYEGVFMFGGKAGVEAGIGEFEFFIRDAVSKQDLFRATRARQRVLRFEDDLHLQPQSVELRDMDTGTTYRGCTAIFGREIPWDDGRMQDDEGRHRRELPEEFHVEHHEQIPAEYAYILDPLTRVFCASVATGNPVRWG